MLNVSQDCKETRNAFLWTHILNTPFWALYNLLPFILFRDLGANPWQITLMITLKPVVSIFSVYWSEYVHKRRDRLISNVSWGCILSHLPFFFFPFVDNVWFFVFSFAMYMVLYRGVIPAWMEILKINLDAPLRQRCFALTSTLSYVGSALFPVFFGWVMDDYFQSWRWIFPIASLISLLAVFMQRKIPIPDQPKVSSSYEISEDFIKRPWVKVWELLKARPDYARFQIGFMIGGFGIMILQPILPQFFMGDLALNYVELGLAMTFCKGVGFTLTSGAWSSWMRSENIFRVSSAVMFLGAIFSCALLLSKGDAWWVYAAYICYGIMQAGSELTWKMSGPLFSKQEDSSIYSSVNVLTVGLRGLVANPLGGLIGALISPLAALIVGSILSLIAGFHMYLCSRKLDRLASDS